MGEWLEIKVENDERLCRGRSRLSNIFSVVEASSCMTVRLSWRRTSQPDTQLYRQWWPLCQEVHGWTSGRGKYLLILRKDQIEIFFSRCHVLSLPRSIGGCSPANCMILLKNSLCLSIPVWDPYHMCTLHHCQEESINSRTMEDFQGLTLTRKTFQGLEKLAWSYGKLNTDFGKTCFLCLSANLLAGRWERTFMLKNN